MRGGRTVIRDQQAGALGGIALAITVLTLAIAAPQAAATIDRSDYAAQVNAICVAANAQVQPLVDSGAKKATKRSLAILRRELDSLEVISAAPGDQALVASWLATRRSIQDLVERDVAIARRLQRLENRFFKEKRSSTVQLKSILRRTGRMARTINRLEGKVGQEAGTEQSLAFTLGAIDCIGSIGPEELLEG